MNLSTHIQNTINQSNGFINYCNYWVIDFQKNRSNHMDYHDFLERTARVTKPLSSEKEANFFIIAYGAQHYQSNYKFLQNTFAVDSTTPDTIRVFDYGCGQGIATLGLMDVLICNGRSDIQLEVHLLEPSSLSLDIAQLLIAREAKVRGMNVKIYTQNCYLEDFVVPHSTSTDLNIHLLSNVLDIESVQNSLHGFKNKLKQIHGSHKLWAIDPSFGMAIKGFNAFRQEMDFAQCQTHNNNASVCNYVFDFYKLKVIKNPETTKEQCQLHLSW